MLLQKTPVSLEVAKILHSELLRRLTFGRSHPELISVGSVRREKPLVNDLDIMVVVNKAADQLNEANLKQMRKNDQITILNVYAAGARKRSFTISHKFGISKVDLFLCTKEEKPFSLFHYTGSASYNIKLRIRAAKMNLLLNQYGLYIRSTRTKLPGPKLKTEKDICKRLGVEYKKPKDR